MILTKEQILSADDLPTDTVFVPQWGGDVAIKALDGHGREELERLIEAFKRGGLPGGKAVRAVAAAMSCVEEDGKQMFADTDVPALAKKSGAALDLLFDDILELNAMTKAAAKELEGNSESGQSDDSGSS